MINIDALNAKFRNREDRVKMLLKIFLDSHIDDSKELRAIRQRGDTNAMFQATHKIKGALANLCADEETDLAIKLEKIARSGLMPEIDEVENMASKLDAIHNQIKQYIQ